MTKMTRMTNMPLSDAVMTTSSDAGRVNQLRWTQLHSSDRTQWTSGNIMVITIMNWNGDGDEEHDYEGWLWWRSCSRFILLWKQSMALKIDLLGLFVLHWSIGSWLWRWCRCPGLSSRSCMDPLCAIFSDWRWVMIIIITVVIIAIMAITIMVVVMTVLAIWIATQVQQRHGPVSRHGHLPRQPRSCLPHSPQNRDGDGPYHYFPSVVCFWCCFYLLVLFCSLL